MNSQKTIVNIMIAALLGSFISAGLSYVVYSNLIHHEALRASEVAYRHNDSAFSAQVASGASMVSADTACDWSTVRQRIRDSVVQVFSHVAEFNWIEPYRAPNQGQCRGTAFFIDTAPFDFSIGSDGYLITNAHVVDQAKAVFIQIPSQGKRQFAVDVIGVSIERDLALLRLRSTELSVAQHLLAVIEQLKLANSDLVCGSQEIMTLGYPLGQQSLKGTTGIVSGRERIGGQYMIQISAPINPGNSGGPSINRCGDVVGVNTSGIRDAQNVNYIIPSNEVVLFLKQLSQTMREQERGVSSAVSAAGVSDVICLRKGTLGLIYGTASDELTSFLGNPLPGGLYITDVCPDSLVSKAGLRPGDMIYEMNGHRLDVFGEMSVEWSEDKVGVVDFISRLMYGDPISIKYYRAGTPHDVVISFGLAKLPAIRRMYPGYEAIDYEVLGGMVIMPLSLNLLQIMAPVVPELAWYLDVRHSIDPALIITHIIPDSVVMRSRVLSAGSVIVEVNGKAVGTLEELRAALHESLTSGILTIKTKENVFAVFPFGQLLSEEDKLARNFCYEITPAVRALRAEAKKSTQQLVDAGIVSSSAGMPPLSVGKISVGEDAVESAR